eukprot:1315104-Amphidinium_carterae.3
MAEGSDRFGIFPVLPGRDTITRWCLASLYWRPVAAGHTVLDLKTKVAAELKKHVGHSSLHFAQRAVGHCGGTSSDVVSRLGDATALSKAAGRHSSNSCLCSAFTAFVVCVLWSRLVWAAVENSGWHTSQLWGCAALCLTRRLSTTLKAKVATGWGCGLVVLGG